MTTNIKNLSSLSFVGLIKLKKGQYVKRNCCRNLPLYEVLTDRKKFYQIPNYQHP